MSFGLGRILFGLLNFFRGEWYGYRRSDMGGGLCILRPNAADLVPSLTTYPSNG